MLKNALRIFFKNLIYLFVTMGTVYLFTIFAIFLFIGSEISNIQTVVNDTGTLIQSAVDSSSTAVKNFFSYAVSQVDMSGNIFDVIKRMIDTKWLQNTLWGFLETLNVSAEGFEDELNVIVYQFIERLKTDILMVILLLIIGMSCAYYATRVTLRAKNAKRGMKKFIIAKLIEPFLTVGVFVLSFLLLVVFQGYAVLFYIALAILFAFGSLLSSWLIHRDQSMKLKDVVNWKNVLMYLLSVLVVLAIDIVLAVVLVFINVLLAVLIMVPLMIYSLNIIKVNTDSFVCERIKIKNEEKAQPLPTVLQ